MLAGREHQQTVEWMHKQNDIDHTVYQVLDSKLKPIPVEPGILKYQNWAWA